MCYRDKKKKQIRVYYLFINRYFTTTLAVYLKLPLAFLWNSPIWRELSLKIYVQEFIRYQKIVEYSNSRCQPSTHWTTNRCLWAQEGTDVFYSDPFCFFYFPSLLEIIFSSLLDRLSLSLLIISSSSAVQINSKRKFNSKPWAHY